MTPPDLEECLLLLLMFQDELLHGRGLVAGGGYCLSAAPVLLPTVLTLQALQHRTHLHNTPRETRVDSEHIQVIMYWLRTPLGEHILVHVYTYWHRTHPRQHILAQNTSR